MKYKIDQGGTAPMYIQIYLQIKADIVNGVYNFGDKLPSKRTLADETGISTVTVEHAYDLLAEEGYIEPKERSGYIVIFKTADGFLKSDFSPAVFSTYHLEREKIEFPFSVYTKTMRKVINDYQERILQKSPNKGLIELREKIQQYLLKNRGIKAEIEQIIIGSGAEYLYGFLAKLMQENCVYGLESPSYEKIETIYRSANVNYEFLPLGLDGIDSYALKETNANVLHITPYRSFPTGVTASASKRHEYLRWAKERNGFIIEDDFESEFSMSAKAEETLFNLSDDDNIVYMNTFTRTISPSLRVGYMVLPKRLVKVFEQKLGFYSCTVPTFEQLVIAELIRNGDFERHINRERRKMRKQGNKV